MLLVLEKNRKPLLDFRTAYNFQGWPISRIRNKQNVIKSFSVVSRVLLQICLFEYIYFSFTLASRFIKPNGQLVKTVISTDNKPCYYRVRPIAVSLWIATVVPRALSMSFCFIHAQI